MMKPVNVMDIWKQGATEKQLDTFANRIKEAYVDKEGRYFVKGVDIDKGYLSAYMLFALLDRLAEEDE